MIPDEVHSQHKAAPSVYRVTPHDLATSGNLAKRRSSHLIFLSTALGTFLVTANVSTMNVAFPT